MFTIVLSLIRPIFENSFERALIKSPTFNAGEFTTLQHTENVIGPLWGRTTPQTINQSKKL